MITEEGRFMKLSIIKYMELYVPDTIGTIKIKYEQPNIEIIKLEETNIVITSLVPGNGQNKEYPNQW